MSVSVPFRLRNDLYCVGWGVKLYSLTHALVPDVRGRKWPALPLGIGS